MRTDPDEALYLAVAEASAASRRFIAPEPVPLDWARSVLELHYGLAGALTPMAAGNDTHFRLDLADGSAGDFQVFHPDADPQRVDFESEALLHIARVDPGLPVQRPVASQHGATWLRLPDDQGRLRAVRLTSLLEGLPLAEAHPLPGETVAKTLARLDRALARLWHFAGETELPGDIQRADRIRALLDLMPDTTHRTLAHQALDVFEDRAKPVLPALRRQPIHNDIGVRTLLANPEAPTEIAGILDFGGMVEAPLVCELAGAASWQFGGMTQAPGEPALASVARFAAAYHSVSPLQDIEMRVLVDLIRARLAMALAIGCWRIAREPRSASDLQRQNTRAGHRLGMLAHYRSEQAYEAVAQACMAAVAARS